MRDETGTPTGNRYAPAPPRPPLSRYSRYSSALENPKDRACWRACSKLGRVRPPANLSVRSARGATGSPRRRGCSAGGRRSGRRSKPGTDGAPEAAQGPAARAPMRHSSGLGAKAPVAGRGSQEPRASSTSKAGRDMPGARAPVAARSSPGELLRLAGTGDAMSTIEGASTRMASSGRGRVVALALLACLAPANAFLLVGSAHRVEHAPHIHRPARVLLPSAGNTAQRGGGVASAAAFPRGVHVPAARLNRRSISSPRASGADAADGAGTKGGVGLVFPIFVVSAIVNRIIYKIQLVPMRDYTYFLSQFSCCCYVIVCECCAPGLRSCVRVLLARNASRLLCPDAERTLLHTVTTSAPADGIILLSRIRSGIVTQPMLSYARDNVKVFAVIGTLEALTFLLALYSAARIPGGLIGVLGQVRVQEFALCTHPLPCHAAPAPVASTPHATCSENI